MLVPAASPPGEGEQEHCPAMSWQRASSRVSSHSEAALWASLASRSITAWRSHCPSGASLGGITSGPPGPWPPSTWDPSWEQQQRGTTASSQAPTQRRSHGMAEARAASSWDSLTGPPSAQAAAFFLGGERRPRPSTAAAAYCIAVGETRLLGLCCCTAPPSAGGAALPLLSFALFRCSPPSPSPSSPRPLCASTSTHCRFFT
mmetsp:Transcript_38536/g.108959  ORF Transcript_38536/g.108959 Transcript_38536/m.108959 type:complete len:203 (+) Transcript_38536:606-1214(+)